MDLNITMSEQYSDLDGVLSVEKMPEMSILVWICAFSEASSDAFRGCLRQSVELLESLAGRRELQTISAALMMYLVYGCGRSYGDFVPLNALVWCRSKAVKGRRNVSAQCGSCLLIFKRRLQAS